MKQAEVPGGRGRATEALGTVTGTDGDPATGQNNTLQ
jgi:hypothetical protein